MKIQKLILAIAFVMGAQAQAQTKVAQYDEATNTVIEAQPAQQPQAVRPQVIQGQPAQVVILTNNQKAVQDQPNTTVEASPLTESQAERLRKQRQGLEVNTEQKIVEKLEQSRMDDEKARADRLFGNAFVAPTPTPAPAPVAPVEAVPVVVVPPPAPVQAVAPAPVVESKKDDVDVRSEVRAALEDLNKKEEPKSQYYIGALIGTAEYKNADNVKGNVAGGVTVGVLTSENLAVEGTFMYSDYDVDDFMQAQFGQYPFKTMTQYGFQGAVKFLPLTGKVRPFVGAVAGYTYREYQNRESDLYGNNGYGPWNNRYQQQYGSYYNDEKTSTNAIDVGLTGGLDVQLSKSFAIGGELRYMTNVWKTRSDLQDFFENYTGAKPVEKTDYYTMAVSGKFTF